MKKLRQVAVIHRITIIFLLTVMTKLFLNNAPPQMNVDPLLVVMKMAAWYGNCPSTALSPLVIAGLMPISLVSNKPPPFKRFAFLNRSGIVNSHALIAMSAKIEIIFSIFWPRLELVGDKLLLSGFLSHTRFWLSIGPLIVGP
jgi:hypothetical protein